MSGDVAIVVDTVPVRETVTGGVAVIVGSAVVKDIFIKDFASTGDLVVAEIIIAIESIALFIDVGDTQSLMGVISETSLTSKTKYDWKSRVLKDLTPEWGARGVAG